MDDFPKPETVTLHLSGKQTVVIRKRLTHGETDDMHGKAIENRANARTIRIAAYLLRWSLTRDGQPVPMSPDLDEKTRTDTIRALDPDRAEEIYDAIDAHRAAMKKERDEQKKILSGESESSVTSTSRAERASGSPTFAH